jgi:hypothetical protein
LEVGKLKCECCNARLLGSIHKLLCGLAVGTVSASRAGFAVGKTGSGLKADHVAAINRRPINGPRGTEVALVKFIPSAMSFFKITSP